MRRIPESFQCGSLTFKVRRVSSEELEKLAGTPAYGVILYDSQEIFIQKAGKTCSAALAWQSFFHEYAHALLWVMNHRDKTNEKVVDQLGHVLKQFHDTAR